MTRMLEERYILLWSLLVKVLYLVILRKIFTPFAHCHWLPNDPETLKCLLILLNAAKCRNIMVFKILNFDKAEIAKRSQSFARTGQDVQSVSAGVVPCRNEMTACLLVVHSE